MLRITLAKPVWFYIWAIRFDNLGQSLHIDARRIYFLQIFLLPMLGSIADFTPYKKK
ncbi:MAG: hypothetical protein IPG58_01105 [Acidobacteria bacterium]|nr:hypothetical protein [Acidobacteriota bacterium]